MIDTCLKIYRGEKIETEKVAYIVLAPCCSQLECTKSVMHPQKITAGQFFVEELLSLLPGRRIHNRNGVGENQDEKLVASLIQKWHYTAIDNDWINDFAVLKLGKQFELKYQFRLIQLDNEQWLTNEARKCVVNLDLENNYYLQRGKSCKCNVYNNQRMKKLIYGKENRSSDDEIHCNRNTQFNRYRNKRDEDGYGTVYDFIKWIYRTIQHKTYLKPLIWPNSSEIWQAATVSQLNYTITHSSQTFKILVLSGLFLYLFYRY